MPILFVAGQARLFVDLIAALLEAVVPGVLVIREASPHASPTGVRVTLQSTDRWLFVSSNHGPDAAAVEALAKGASAALNIDSGTDEFRQAINALIDGKEPYLQPGLLKWMMAATFGGAKPQAAQLLSAREREVLHLLATGLSNHEIAHALTISIHTVRSHLQSVSEKLEVRGRTRLLARARALGIPEAGGHSTELPASA